MHANADKQTNYQHNCTITHSEKQNKVILAQPLVFFNKTMQAQFTEAFNNGNQGKTLVEFLRSFFKRINIC